MKAFTLLLIGLILAGILVRILKILFAKDKSERTLRKKELSWISLSLLCGYVVYFLALMYAPDKVRSFSTVIGITFLSIQGGRFMYKFMQLRKMHKEVEVSE